MPILVSIFAALLCDNKTGSDVELFNNALAEVKSKAFERSAIGLGDGEALEALVAVEPLQIPILQ